MSTWWKADKYGCKIKPVQVVSETAKYIALEASESYWKKTQRVLKGDEYFPTFAEARRSLLDMLNARFSSTERELESLREKTINLIMLEPPKESK